MPADVVPPNIPYSSSDIDAAGNDPFSVGPGPVWDPMLDRPMTYTSMSSSGPLMSYGGQPKRRPARLADVATAVVLPWLVFFLVLSLFLFAYHEMEMVVWILITLCGGLSMLFLCLGACARHGSFLAVGFLCATSVGMASACGLWLNSTYLERYWELDAGQEFKHVAPTSSAKETAGASVIHFTEGTFVDDRRTLGFVAGGIVLCLAPVVAPDAPAALVEYWAVGEDCCEMRCNFDCGTARDLGATTAVTERRGPLYNKAIAQAMSVYGLNSTDDAQLVSFVNNPKAVIADIWDESLTIALIAMIMDLCMCVVAGLVVARVLSRAGPRDGFEKSL
eukprot:CAMPEP_0177232656 /NCGR_PEP_ID=MMETSP0367-20130122/43440_1 /TAXON_ID=447022 ORGANISM="Scrippsiella hangoei-like, Strain SHHI-4" /NCGR_SAMPLE_ID=MMETSP0367 /ASSEMBLY_ACC=CAM_ASM_000362 /LENGTH=334 /DNA_ID=CAMNT_0018683319 /DNA_START=16 /DNA_END=1020 /DNA_ORIENTATION=+